MTTFFLLVRWILESARAHPSLQIVVVLVFVWSPMARKKI